MRLARLARLAPFAFFALALLAGTGLVQPSPDPCGPYPFGC